jgi:hypothetical protein
LYQEKNLPLYVHMLSSIILYKDYYLNYSHQLVMCTFESYQLDLIKPGALSSGMSAFFSSKSPSLKMTSALFNLFVVLRQYDILTKGWVRG